MTPSPESLLALWRQRDLDGLLAQVARSRRIGALQILSDARARIYSDARHELYLALRELGLSYPSIGALFGRDPSSISVAIRLPRGHGLARAAQGRESEGEVIEPTLRSVLVELEAAKRMIAMQRDALGWIEDRSLEYRRELDAKACLASLAACAAEWEPRARLIGNIQAGDIKAALAESGGPAEKPLPDAPGWWITVVGRSVDDRVTEFRQIVSCDDGLLYEIDQDDGEMFPVSRFAPMRWYGPIALPWEAT